MERRESFERHRQINLVQMRDMITVTTTPAIVRHDTRPNQDYCANQTGARLPIDPGTNP